MIYGAQVLTATLEALGVQHVFGLPGTQNLAVFEALRRSRLRAVVASDEMAATFMGCGYARAGRRLGVVTTISGPGFTYALTALAEARADSTPLLLITQRQKDSGHRFQLQRIDQAAMAAPVVKQCLHANRIDTLPTTIVEGARIALTGEPGPVLLEIDAALLGMQLDGFPAIDTLGVRDDAICADAPFSGDAFRQLHEALRLARYPLVLAGQGALGASAELRSLVESVRMPCMTTLSGRGVLPESHPLCLPPFGAQGTVAQANALIERCDLLLVLGCKFSHNGCAGFALRVPEGRMVQVDSCTDVIGANYPVRLGLTARCEDVLQRLVAKPWTPSDWQATEIEQARKALRATPSARNDEPHVGGSSELAGDYLAALCAASGTPRFWVTDSGRNQSLSCRSICVNTQGGFIAPADFQSMGFGLPAALGAKYAVPDATVIACIGDGGFLQMATELQTASREGIDIGVIVLDDGKFGYIERQQSEQFGVRSGTELGSFAIDQIAEGMSAGCRTAGQPDGDAKWLEERGVRVITLPLREGLAIRVAAAKSRSRELALSALPGWLIRAIKQLLGL